MVYLKLLQNNNIVTMETPGKNIIKSSSGMMFHNSMELLCVALGSCVGKHIVRYCAQEKIQVESFESISIDMADGNYDIHLQYSPTVTEAQRLDLKNVILNCDVANMLKGTLNIKFSPNKVEPEVTRKRKPCCGG